MIPQQLAVFLKKRDPRFMNSMATNATSKDAPTQQRMASSRAAEREREAQSYRVPSWQITDPPKASVIVDSDGDEQLESGEDDIEGIWCAACEKSFGSENAWTNHEKSRKHIKMVQRYDIDA